MHEAQDFGKMDHGALVRGYGAIGMEVQALLGALNAVNASLAGLAAATQAARVGLAAYRRGDAAGVPPGGEQMPAPAPAGYRSAARDGGGVLPGETQAGGATREAAQDIAPAPALPASLQQFMPYSGGPTYLVSIVVPERGAGTNGRKALDAPLAGALAGAVLRIGEERPARSHTGQAAHLLSGDAAPVPQRQYVDPAVLPPPGGEPRGRFREEWLRDTSTRAGYGDAGTAWAGAAAGRDGQVASLPARVALPLFPGISQLALPRSAPAPPPAPLEVRVKEGQELTAAMTRIADERIELVVLPALRRANR